MKQESDVDKGGGKQKSSVQSLKVRNINFSTAEEDLLCKIVLKYSEVLVEKTSNKYSNARKSQTWKLIEKEFNSSSISKTFRSAMNLKSKYKNIKASVRKDYAANKLVFHRTSSGKTVSSQIDAQLSSAMQELRSLIALTLEELASNSKSDNNEAVESSDSVSVKRPRNSETGQDEPELSSGISDVTSEEIEILCNELITGPVKTIESNVETVQTKTSNNDKKQDEIKKPPMHESQKMPLKRKSKFLRNRRYDGVCIAKAKAAFYLNEDKRAAEQHEFQMKMLHERREEKKVEHAKCMEEHRLRIELLNAQIESIKRKQTTTSASPPSSSPLTYVLPAELGSNHYFCN